MKPIFNKWLGYTDRTIEQQEAAIIAKINTPDGIPEMTDHTSSNVFIKMIRIWTAISELFHSYIDHYARELFPTVAQEFKSLAFTASLFDYRIRGVIPATVDQTFFIAAPATEPISIPDGTRVKSKNNVVFYTTQSATIGIGQTQVTVPAINAVPVNGVQIGIGNGQKFQKFPINPNVVDESITFTTGVNSWISVDSLISSPANHYAFVASLNENGVMTVKTGDGINGSIPPSGIPLIASYKTSSGAAGNLPAKTIVEIESTVTVPTGVILQTVNNIPSANGADKEDTETLRMNLVNFLHTTNRAVTLEDYEKIAVLAPGVAKARAKFETKRVVTVFIAPTGSSTGIASTGLIASTLEYISKRKLIGKPVNVQSAGVIKIKIVAVLNLKDGYLKTPKIAEAKTLLSQFLSIPNQEINGSVGLGDLYQILEGIVGVKLANVVSVIPVPYARPLNHYAQLVWTRAIKPTSNAVVRWKVLVLSPTTYTLIRNTSYIGTYNFGDLVTFNEVEFTITYNSYATNLAWEFYTYPYNTGSVNLEEPSIPVADVDDIEITAIGGI